MEKTNRLFYKKLSGLSELRKACKAYVEAVKDKGYDYAEVEKEEVFELAMQMCEGENIFQELNKLK